MISQSLKPDVRTMLVEGGFAGKSIFPRLAYQLENSNPSLEALYYVSKSKKVERYVCLIDFLFCEVFPRYRSSCFNFYKDPDRYPPLRDRVTKEELEEMQYMLLWIISYARMLHEKSESVESWSKFIAQAKRVHKRIWDAVNALSEEEIKSQIKNLEERVDSDKRVITL